ncbi:hypothetical protein B9Z55_008188 [Caenorhabditis nigoni]|uniref:Uncharacterized protein n=1 Tax=Caenorhabditis nigoni TaxID=1611254 RepID=A0A2G5VD03_9PELO|nr:hypothetical protein B9Z55_008187 [Caenorhabditis nigoni]PIC49649.1 hypothetical protein B9Z55_008188 [Caenorhabditis nigoni]
MDRINCYQKKDYYSSIIYPRTVLECGANPRNVRSLMDRINCYQKKDYCRFKDRESKITSNLGKTALSSIQEQCSSVGRTHGTLDH